MDKQKNKLGFSGRLIRWSLIGEKNSFKSSNFLAIGFLAISIGRIILGIKRGESEQIGLSIAFGMLALIWFQRAGFMELIEKEYTKKTRTRGSTLR